MTFHDNKLWQDAYVAALDVAESFDGASSEVAVAAKQTSLTILATIADSLTRRDRREAEVKMRDAGGSVAAMRSLLSVAWAQNQLTDDQFGKVDGAYEALSAKLK